MSDLPDEILDAIDAAVVDGTDLYTVLGAPRFAANADIKLAYKRAAMRLHPDRHADKSPEERDELEAEFKRVGNALSVLTDEDARAIYDERMGFRPSFEIFNTSVCPAANDGSNSTTEPFVDCGDDERQGTIYVPIACLSHGVSIEWASQRIDIAKGAVDGERVAVEVPGSSIVHLTVRTLPHQVYERGGTITETTPADLVMRTKRTAANRGVVETIDGRRGIWVADSKDAKRVTLKGLGLPKRDNPDQFGNLVIVLVE